MSLDFILVLNFSLFCKLKVVFKYYEILVYQDVFFITIPMKISIPFSTSTEIGHCNLYRYNLIHLSALEITFNFIRMVSIT